MKLDTHKVILTSKFRAHFLPVRQHVLLVYRESAQKESAETHETLRGG